MIQLLFTLSHYTHGKIRSIGIPAQATDKFLVVFRLKPHLSRPELPEIPFRFFSRRNMEIIRVHHCMRGYHNNRFRLQRGDFPCRFLISLRRFPDTAFLPFSDFRNNQWRMRNHKTCSHCHFRSCLHACACCQNHTSSALSGAAFL